jgi:hypothetical protein
MRKKSASLSYTPQNFRVCKKVLRGGTLVGSAGFSLCTALATDSFSSCCELEDSWTGSGRGARWYSDSSTTKKARISRAQAKANST